MIGDQETDICAGKKAEQEQFELLILWMKQKQI